MEKNKNNVVGSFLGKKMTRKEAIKKAGITALTTASLVFLSTNASSAASNPKAPNSTQRRRN